MPTEQKPTLDDISAREWGLMRLAFKGGLLIGAVCGVLAWLLGSIAGRAFA